MVATLGWESRARARASERKRSRICGWRRVRRDYSVGGGTWLVDAKRLQKHLKSRERRGRRSLADAFAELRALIAESPGELSLDTPERRDRENAFAETSDR
jgi:hypothetical protein